LSAIWQKWRWDGLGLGLAGLCLVHCLAASILVVFLASAGSVLLSPAVHETGLLLAVLVAVVALGKGVIDRGLIMPAAIGGVGIGAMAGALTMEHGSAELFATILGLAMLSIGHYLNYRAAK
jgi:uncharacterized membrane protein YfcA